MTVTVKGAETQRGCELPKPHSGSGQTQIGTHISPVGVGSGCKGSRHGRGSRGNPSLEGCLLQESCGQEAEGEGENEHRARES